MTARRFVIGLGLIAAVLVGVGVGVSVLFSGGPSIPHTSTYTCFYLNGVTSSTDPLCQPGHATTTTSPIAMPLGELVVALVGALLVVALAVAAIVFLVRDRQKVRR